MVQIKHFTASQNIPNVQFSRRANWPWRDKILSALQRGQKIIVNESKPFLVIVSIKFFTCLSFRQNCFSLRNWAGGFYWDSLVIVEFLKWQGWKSGTFFNNCFLNTMGKCHEWFCTSEYQIVSFFYLLVLPSPGHPI